MSTLPLTAVSFAASLAAPLRVSVVIPAYRAAETIGRALESVLAQTWPVHEILVIDDGSPDDLDAALAPYQGRITLLRQTNQGAAAARNLGLDEATGDLIAFLDADDQWSPDKLEKCVQTFVKWPETGLVASRYLLQDETSSRPILLGPSSARCLPSHRVAPPEVLDYAREISTPTVVVRRSALGSQRFDPTLTTAEDRDLWIRLLLATPVQLLDEPLCRVYHRPDSLSHANIDADSRCMLEVIRRYTPWFGPLAARRERAYVEYKWAAGHRRRIHAFGHWLRSVWLWPLPFAKKRTRCHLARPRTLLSLLRPRRGR